LQLKAIDEPRDLPMCCTLPVAPSSPGRSEIWREAEEGTHSAELRFLLDLARIEETEVRGMKVCRTTLCDTTSEQKCCSFASMIK
jgi:hypothetical protein